MTTVKYLGPNTVAKRQTLFIPLDDPKISPLNIGQTNASVGAEIKVVGGTSVFLASNTLSSPDNGFFIATPIQLGGNKNNSTLQAITNLQYDWTTQDLILTFNFDTTNTNNALLNDFLITFYQGTTAYPVQSFIINKTSTSQTYKLTAGANGNMFGIPATSFTKIHVAAQDSNGNTGPYAELLNVAHHSTLPVATYSVTAMQNGYYVAFTNVPTSDPSYNYIEVVEYVSDSATEPTGVDYQEVYLSSQNPAFIITSTTQKRWVKARYTDKLGDTDNAFGIAYSVTPINPVQVDTIPPDEVQSVSAAWSGDNIVITYKLPVANSDSSNVPIRLIALLTEAQTNGRTASITFYPNDRTNSSTNQTFTIAASDIAAQTGNYFSSYNGVLKGADAVDNRTSGKSFSTGTRVNPLLGITPSLSNFNIIGIPNGFVLIPYNSPSGATYTNIYARSTDWGSDTPTSVDLVGVTTTGIPFTYYTTSFDLIYLKMNYTNNFGDFSNFSTGTSTQPLDPASFTTAPPAKPSIALETNGATYNSLNIKISTSDTTVTKGYYVMFGISGSMMNAMTMNMVPIVGADTDYLITNLLPNTSYDIYAVGYNDSNVLGTYSDMLTLTTLTVSPSAPTNVTLTPSPYSALATWTAPNSSPSQIAQYGIALYNSTNSPTITLLSEEYTFGTTYSIAGLLSNNSYYIKVYSKDIYGNESDQVQSSTITLNSVGQTSNGSAPNSSPTPTVIPLFAALEVKWTAISNVDATTYEVHISKTNNFTPSSLTKSIETFGTFAVIKTLPDGSALDFVSTYYVKIVAKDFDGSAPASTQASGTPSQINNGDLAANSVVANNIIAGSINADKVDATNLLVNKIFSVGSGGSYQIKIDASGNGTTTPYKLVSGYGSYSDTGTAFYLDSNGKFSLKDRLYFDGNSTLTVNGVINAQSGNFAGAMTVDNGTMKFGKSVNGSNSGIYIGATGDYIYSDGKFSLGSNRVTWDGSALTIAGNINAAGGTFTGNVGIGTGSIYGSSGSYTISGVVGNGTNAVFTTTTAHGFIANTTKVFINGLTNAGFYGIYTVTAVTTNTFTVANTTNATLTGQTGIVQNITNGFVLNSNTLNFGNSTFIDAAGGGVLYTSSANIGGWTVDKYRISHLRSGKYIGLSTTDTYAIFAGGTDSTGTSAAFGVTPTGAVTATNMTILGGSLDIGSASPNGFHVTSGGIMTAAGATIDGTITARGGSFTGNVQLNGGSLYAGTTPNTGPSLTINSTGLAAFSSGSTVTTEILTTPLGTTSGTSTTPRNNIIPQLPSGFPQIGFFTQAASIGGFIVDSTRIMNSAGTLVLTSGTAAGERFAITDSQNVYKLQLSVPSLGTDNIIAAGGYTVINNINTYTPTFRVTAAGKLYATGAEISGNIIAKGFFIDQNNYWNTSTDGLSITGNTFNVGSSNSFINATSTGVVTLQSSYTRSNSTGNSGTGADTAISANVSSKIVVGSNLVLQGIPTYGNMDNTNNNSSTTTPYLGVSGFGTLPRQRMVIEDPVTGQLALGMAVYYANTTYHNSTPGASSGVVGDLWVQY